MASNFLWMRSGLTYLLGFAKYITNGFLLYNYRSNTSTGNLLQNNCCYSRIKATEQIIVFISNVSISIAHPTLALTLSQVSRSIKVRPNSQQGVLPPGFLAIFDTPGAQTSSDGKELLPCRLGTECLMSCFSIGQNISGMDLKRILPDGTEQDVPSAQSNVMATSTSDGIFWTFEAEESSGDDNGITTFKCYVRDDVHGTEKTKLVGVQITIASSIDTNRSSVKVEDDPDDPTKRIVTFSCAVSGRPLPDIVFHGGSTGAFPIWGEAPDNIITVGNVETMATKTVTVDASALKRASNDINRERASSPDCTITEAFTGDFKQQFFSFLDLNQHTARY
ncbi:hypothetical protein PoB_001977700 [Plakobranchus ocellatus]|uniref:Ig-like domain-containing protein n=1 Tax=Plakobranchus ocellatus TaxID=259542 RepID=A0AAV3ZDA4_9GAST|nr:hypothetical protein PoB_001977700 [Plakobranchus ocellatus]